MIDISTNEKKKIAINNFRSLLTHPGWIMYEEIVRANIDVVKNQILDGGDNQTIEDVKTLRKVLSLHNEMIDTPNTMIKLWSIEAVENTENLDPYDITEEIV